MQPVKPNIALNPDASRQGRSCRLALRYAAYILTALEV